MKYYIEGLEVKKEDTIKEFGEKMMEHVTSIIKRNPNIKSWSFTINELKLVIQC